MTTISPPLKLNTFQTSIALPLKSYSAETYVRRLVLSGNSVLSTVYCTQIDVGATLKVQYYESTTGELLGEKRIIGGHSLLDSSNFSNVTPEIKTITPFHREPHVEAIVLNGSATFSVFLTTVTSFSSVNNDLAGTTNQINGTATTVPSFAPISAGNSISQILVRSVLENAKENKLLVSFDSGSNFFTLNRSESLIWSLKGDVKQIILKSSQNSADYELIFNQEL